MQTTTRITEEGYVRSVGRREEVGVNAGKGAVMAGRLLSGLVAIFLLFDGAARLVRFAPYVEGTVQYGYPEQLASGIGLTLLVSTILYVLQRTAVLGAILVTGYLGGAAASHVRFEDPWFLFPVALGALAWAGLYLRDTRVRALVPLRS